MKLKLITLAVLAAMSQPVLAATPATWVTNYDAATYNAAGTITFND